MNQIGSNWRIFRPEQICQFCCYIKCTKSNMKDLILYPLLIYLLIVYCIFIYISICFFFVYINQCLFFIYYSHREFCSWFLIRVTIGNDKDESAIKMRELSTRQFLVTILKCCKLTMRQMEKTIERKRRENRDPSLCGKHKSENSIGVWSQESFIARTETGNMIK